MDLDKLLSQIDDLIPEPITLADGDFVYILSPEKATEWLVRKMDDDRVLADYTVRRYGRNWGCNCPAGMRYRNCKHVAWVTTIMRFPIWVNWLYRDKR